MKRTSPSFAAATRAVARSVGLLLALTAVAVSAVPAERPGGPDFMPAHPELLARVGKAGLVRLTGEQTPVEMYTESRDARAKAGADKISGSGTCLVILWQFTDHPADVTAHPASAYQNLLFSTGTWPTGSMNDYFREVSYGAFGVSGASIGWTTSSTTYASYTPHDFLTTRTMIQNAIAQLDPGVNFALYDNDGPDGVPHSADDDGYVDALFFVHAGPGQEETGNPDDIWSHAWSFPGGLATGDGVRIGRYSVEPEETASGGLVAIGVFCHEYGHVLGLPDLYDTDYSSSGVGEWCLMSGGSWNARSGGQWGSCPAHPSGVVQAAARLALADGRHHDDRRCNASAVGNESVGAPHLPRRRHHRRRVFPGREPAPARLRCRPDPTPDPVRPARARGAARSARRRIEHQQRLRRAPTRRRRGGHPLVHARGCPVRASRRRGRLGRGALARQRQPRRQRRSLARLRVRERRHDRLARAAQPQPLRRRHRAVRHRLLLRADRHRAHQHHARRPQRAGRLRDRDRARRRGPADGGRPDLELRERPRGLAVLQQLRPRR